LAGGLIPVTQVSTTAINGRGWNAVIGTNGIDITFLSVTDIITFTCSGIMDDGTQDSTIGVHQSCTTFPSITEQGYFNNTTVSVTLGSNTHIIGITFFAILK
jgi:ribose/xylose/arabinose/galactoside ABC-type transport system permease subunit